LHGEVVEEGAGPQPATPNCDKDDPVRSDDDMEVDMEVGDIDEAMLADGSLERVSAPPPSAIGRASEGPDDASVAANALVWAQNEVVQAAGEPAVSAAAEGGEPAVSAAEVGEVQATSAEVGEVQATSAEVGEEPAVSAAGEEATSDSESDSSENSSSSSSEGEETWDEIAARATTEAAQRMSVPGSVSGDDLAIVPWQAHWRGNVRGPLRIPGSSFCGVPRRPRASVGQSRVPGPHSEEAANKRILLEYLLVSCYRIPELPSFIRFPCLRLRCK
jgi:hypothetical protein